MKLWTLIGRVGLVLLAIAIVVIGVREHYSYLVARTVTITETDRIYPVWGDPLTSDLMFVSLVLGIMLGGGYILDWLDKHGWGFL